jgi:hypothetical protein
MNRTLLLYGFCIWVVATIFLRFAGQHVLHPGALFTLVLFALSFVAMAWLARRLCRRQGLPREQWLAGESRWRCPPWCLTPFPAPSFRSSSPTWRCPWPACLAAGC